MISSSVLGGGSKICVSRFSTRRAAASGGVFATSADQGRSGEAAAVRHVAQGVSGM